MSKRILTDREHIELINVAWLNLCQQYQNMGEQLKEFGMLLAGFIEDQDKDEKQKETVNIVTAHRLSRLSQDTKKD